MIPYSPPPPLKMIPPPYPPYPPCHFWRVKVTFWAALVFFIYSSKKKKCLRPKIHSDKKYLILATCSLSNQKYHFWKQKYNEKFDILFEHFAVQDISKTYGRTASICLLLFSCIDVVDVVLISINLMKIFFASCVLAEMLFNENFHIFLHRFFPTKKNHFFWVFRKCFHHQYQFLLGLNNNYFGHFINFIKVNCIC